MRLREVADRVGITERAVHKIVADLEDGGVITRTKDGRRNRYRIHEAVNLRHPVESHCTVGTLLDMVRTCAGSGSKHAPVTSNHETN